MEILIVILGYIKWHYSRAVLSLSTIWKNLFSFLFNYFSVKFLFLNFFDPWKKMSDSYPKFFNIKKYLDVFLANLIMRTVGIIMRTILLIVSFLSFILLILLYPLFLVIWILLPGLVILLAGTGVFIIFNLN